MKKKGKKHLRKRTRRVLIFGFLSIVICGSTLFSITNVVWQIVDKYQEASTLEKKLVSLTEEEKELNDEIVKLEDKDYLARYAREKYFYSKNNEIIIRIPTK